MKKQIFDYIRQHPDCTHHQVSAALEVEEMQALSAMQELEKEGFLAVKARPLGNIVDPNCSAFYCTTKDFYPRQEDGQLKK